MANYRLNGIKWDRANWANVDADCVKGLNAYVVARETRLNTVSTSEVIYSDGPFAGQTIELCDEDDNIAAMLPLNFKGWIGCYNGGRWQGTKGQPLAVVDDAGMPKEAGSLGKGFNALRQLLAELGEDPAERAFMRPKTKSVLVQYGFTDDFGTRIEYAMPRGGYYVWLEQVPNLLNKSRKRGYLTIERIDYNTSGNYSNAWAADDFGDLYKVPDSYSASSHDERAEYVITEPFARYSIGRTSYTIRATAEAVNALRQRILKAKKWYADKHIQAARPIQSAEDEARDLAQLAAIDASIETQARQDVAQVLASAQAAAAIEQAQTVAIEQTEQASGSDARRELVTCELGTSNAQGVSVGSAGGFTVAAYDRVMGALNGTTPPPASPAPGVGGVFHSNLESEPAKNPTAYCLPAGRVHDGWAACKSADFTPDARQQMVMDAVSIALGEGLFYTKDVLARCVDLLAIDANTQATRSKRVEGGDVGMDVYYARQAVEAKAANQASREIAGALNLHVGDVLGTLVFSDYKRCTGVTIAAISETGLCFTISGKRGTSTVSGDVGADNLKQSINRAHEKGLRKTNFEQFAQGRQPVEPENCAAAEVTATPAAGVCTSAPARQAQNAAPVSSGQFKSKTDGVSGELKTPAAQDAGGVSSGQFKKKNEAAAAGFDAPAATKPTIKGKSGKWRAWFATTKKGKLILDFESDRIRVCDAHDTASARMAALTALAQQADFVPPNPPEKPGGREGSFVQNSKPVSPEPAASPAGGLSITLTRAEGNCETDSFEPVTVASFAAADALLHGWSETAPAKGGYNKCDFSIVWPDGGSYEGRYDLKHHSIEPASLSAHMIDQAEYQTGKFCPLHMSAAAYAQRMAETSDETRAVYAEILATMASLGAYFPKLRPVALDLRALVAAGAAPAALVGLGVSYCGDCCNASGRGAIVATGKDEYYGLVVDVVLEDGREHRQTRAANFGDGIGARYRLDGKQHGAPYLAQLAGAVATAKAQASATKEQADKTHAQALIDLAAQHPQLKRYTPGVKLGGVTLAAANVRILLREAFPGVKFSVKTSKFSGGDDLRVSWTDGPTDKQVDAIVSRFDRGHFDGQDDSYSYSSSAFTELFGDAKYTFTNRHESDALILRALATFYPEASERPSVEDWRQGLGAFDCCDGRGARHWFREHIDTMTI